MTNDSMRKLTGEEALALNGGGCAAIGALIATFTLIQNWGGVASGLLAAYHYGCFDNW
jgi:hypothetical protein